MTAPPPLVALFHQLQPLATQAVQHAQLVATATVMSAPSAAAQGSPQPDADVTGRSFFDCKGAELSEEMRKKRTKALLKLQKQEEKRLRAAAKSKTNASAAAVDLDALFAAQAVDAMAAPEAVTPSGMAIDPARSPPCATQSRSPSPQPLVSPLSLSESLSTGETPAPHARDYHDDNADKDDNAGKDDKDDKDDPTAPAVTPVSYLRLTPTRYLFAASDLNALHTVLIALVDLTHPTVLSTPDAPSPTLQVLRRLVCELPDEPLPVDTAHGQEAEAEARSGPMPTTTTPEGETVLEQALVALQPLVLDDVTSAMYVVALMANLSAVPDPLLRQSLPVASMWRLALLAAQRYKSAKRTLHFILTVLSNLAFAGRYVTPVQAPEASDAVTVAVPLREVLSDSDCALLFELGTPYYTEAAVVEAWFVMLCNLVAVHRETIPTFVALGLVAVAERLLVYHGRQPRVVLHGLQLLTNLSTAVVDDASERAMLAPTPTPPPSGSTNAPHAAVTPS